MKNYSNELQIEIDDVYACPGHCPGCVLSSLERRVFLPDMKGNVLEASIDKLKGYIPLLKGLEKINITYGIGDHFLMEDQYLAYTYALAASVIEQSGLIKTGSQHYNGVFYTASMIGRHNIIAKKIDHLVSLSQSRGVPAYIIAVLDPKHLYNTSFADTYKKNIIYAHNKTGRVDLTINLSQEAVEKISAEQLFEFADAHCFDEVTINWTPTKDNLPFVYFDQNRLAKWLIEFDALVARHGRLGTSYRPVMKKTINNLMCKAHDETGLDIDLAQSVHENLPELARKSIQIDNLGNVFPKYEAVGDIAHTPRLGIEAWGNVLSGVTIEEMYQTSLAKTKKFIFKQFNHKPCLDCRYKAMCANSGFHIYNHVLKRHADPKRLQEEIGNNNCPHVAKELFSHYVKEFYQSA